MAGSLPERREIRPDSGQQAFDGDDGGNDDDDGGDDGDDGDGGDDDDSGDGDDAIVIGREIRWNGDNRSGRGEVLGG